MAWPSRSKRWYSRRSCTACRSPCSRLRRRSHRSIVSLLEASATLGASRWRTFCRIVLPLSIDGIVAGAVLSFAHTLGEFGVVLMVGGNLPGVTRTVSIAIYDQVQSFQYAAGQSDGACCCWCSRSRCWRPSTRCFASPGRFPRCRDRTAGGLGSQASLRSIHP